MSREKTLCMIPGCGRKAFTRGVCQRCRENGKAMIKKKLITEEQLIERKALLPKKGKEANLTPLYRFLFGKK